MGTFPPLNQLGLSPMMPARSRLRNHGPEILRRVVRAQRLSQIATLLRRKRKRTWYSGTYVWLIIRRAEFIWSWRSSSGGALERRGDGADLILSEWLFLQQLSRAVFEYAAI
jgi:hypothetical protein